MAEDAVAATTAVAAAVSAQHPLAPPSVTALKKDHGLNTASDAGALPAAATHRSHIERSMSEDIREQREDLKEAAERNQNVIVDLGLDGRVRWVSPSWQDVIGSSAESMSGSPIADILVDDPAIFNDAIDHMQKDDSRSKIIRFRARMGPNSKLKPDSFVSVAELENAKVEEEAEEKEDEAGKNQEKTEEEKYAEAVPTVNLEAQGIMVYDRASGGDSHVCITFCLTLHATSNISTDYVDDQTICHTRGYY